MTEHIDHGGPAFPQVAEEYSHENDRWRVVTSDSGMTLRDYFAAKAMQSLILEGAGHNAHPGQIGPMSSTAWDWADAMLKARAAR